MSKALSAPTLYGVCVYNLQRFRRGIAFNLGPNQQEMVPDADALIARTRRGDQ